MVAPIYFLSKFCCCCCCGSSSSPRRPQYRPLSGYAKPVQVVSKEALQSHLESLQKLPREKNLEESDKTIHGICLAVLTGLVRNSDQYQSMETFGNQGERINLNKASQQQRRTWVYRYLCNKHHFKAKDLVRINAIAKEYFPDPT